MSSKPLGNPPPGDKTIKLDSTSRFYALEEVNETKEGEEAEILFFHDLSLVASKQNFVKREFPYIDTFDHEGPVVISAMRDLTIGVFEHLKITFPMDV